MKVRSLISSNPLVRGAATCLMALALAAGASTPLVASAETAPVQPVASVTAEASATAIVPVEAVTPTETVDATPVLAVAPAPVKPAAKKLTVRQTISKVGRDKGLSKSSVKALLWIAKRESNFHRTSVSSGGCYGLFQLSHSMVRGHPWSNAAWNTKRAIKYMKGRYGSVLKAKAFWAAHHWY